MGQQAAERRGQHRRQTDPMTGVEGNEKLTAMTGAILLLGFAVEGFTIVSIHGLIVMHFVVGFLLIGPVILKIASTVYRFARYYTGSRPYIRKGPPAPILRVLGPLVVLTSLAVLGTGVMLAVVGPGNAGPWLFLHKATFVLWFGAMTIHVLSYAPKLPRILSARQPDNGQPVPGGPARWLALTAALAVGVGVAAATMHMSASWSAAYGGFH